jgi:Reverse transcriptase (RNA-dependent DNA polymerase)
MGRSSATKDLTYGNHFGNGETKLLEFTELESEDEDEDEDEDVIILHKSNDTSETLKEEPRVIVTRSKALMHNLEEEYSDSEGEEGVYMILENEISEPSTFKEAYFDPIAETRTAWREAIKKEIMDMEKCKVWDLFAKKDLPKGCKLIGYKWVFKEKRDGIFRARLVALGYSHIAGIDFTGNYSHVVNDSTFRLVLLVIAKLGLKAWSIDISTAFLNGDLHEEIFMKLPNGYAEVKGKQDDSMCLKLNKSIYGLVHAAREWNRRFNSEMINLGFKINNADPCLFYIKDKGKICILCLYVDDMIITGDVGLMVKTVEGLRNVNCYKRMSSFPAR